MDRQYTQHGDAFVAEDLRQMQLAPRYNAWLYKLCRPLLGRRILEVGAGTGNMTTALLHGADLVVAMEPNAACRDKLQARFDGQPRFACVTSRIEDAQMTLSAYTFDTALFVNVLEHIEDHVAALRIARDLLIDDGSVVLLLPACRAAFGPIDRAVGHFRRYTKPMIKAACHDAGLHVKSARYSNIVGLMGWLFNARIGRITKQNDVQIAVFDSLVPVLSRVEHVLAPPIGLSLIVQARKAR